jgi:hypothetical protein
MGLNITRNLTALAVAMLPLVGATATFSVMGAEAAHAERGNGNGNGGGNGHGRSSDRGGNRSDDRGNGHSRGNGHGHGDGHGRGFHASEGRGSGNGRGAIASELKGLNACHASDQARASASSESQVGRIAAYANAVEAAAGAKEQLEAANTAVTEFKATHLTSDELDAEIAALDPYSETYEADVAALQAEAEDNNLILVELEADVTEAETAVEESGELQAAALNTATGGRELSEEAMAAFEDCLNG